MNNTGLKRLWSNRPFRITFLAVLGLFLAAVLLGPLLFFKQSYPHRNRDDIPGSANVWNIFVCGVDNNNTGGMDKLGNADGEVIVSINRLKRRVFLTSVLRDTFMKFDDGRYGNKATLIYHYYGPESLISAVEESFQIPIDNYVLINYPALINLVDSIGGIEMNVYKEEVIELNAKVIQLNEDLFNLPKYDGIVYTDLDSFEGERTVTLTGKQVAGFARVRLSDSTQNDLGRTDRERRLIMAVKDKFMGLSLAKKISVVRQLLNSVETDLPKARLFSLLMSAAVFSRYPFVSQRIPVDGSFYTQDGYVYPDLEMNRTFLRETIY